MKRIAIVLTLAILGLAAGSAFAAFVSTTSTGVNTFTTRAVTSKPVISGPRLTSDPSCGVGTPADTVRQGGAFYVCVNSVDDAAGVSSVTADLQPVNGDAAIPLFSSGGPFGGYEYRSAAQTASAPLDTGTSGGWAVRATNTNGDRSTLAGNTFNIRSFRGALVGEFGAPAASLATQYYALSEAAGTGTNLGSGVATALTFNGTPTRRVPGALVGSADTAVRLASATDYLSATRRITGADYSVEIWVRGSATSGSGPGTVWSDSAGLIDAGATNSTNDFGVAVDATGRIVAGCGNAGSTLQSNPGMLSDGEWHHVAFSREQASGVIRLYVDGVIRAGSGACNTTNHNASGSLWFGRSHESSLNLLADLDDPVVWGRVLAGTEVRDHFRLGRGIG